MSTVGGFSGHGVGLYYIGLTTIVKTTPANRLQTVVTAAEKGKVLDSTKVVKGRVIIMIIAAACICSKQNGHRICFYTIRPYCRKLCRRAGPIPDILVISV